MSTVIEQIKASRVEARKDINRVIEFNLLTLIVGEVETMSKRPSAQVDDVTVVAIIRKLLASVVETTKVAPSQKLALETEVLNHLIGMYAPQQLSREAIFALLQEANVFNMGEAMKLLKTQHAGQYDGKAASGWVKEYFAE